MLGTENGVATQMQRANPRVVPCHCGGHNLALAAQQAAEEVQYLCDKYDPVLLAIYIFYHYSPTRTDGLKDAQREWDDPTLTMKRSCPTRWASKTEAVAAINDTLPSLLSDFARHAEIGKSAAAIGLNVMAHDFRFVAATALMDDVLPVVNMLSKTMQKADADFTSLVHLVPPVLRVLKDMETMPGPAYKELEERLGEHGDLHGIKLKYMHPDNPIRQAFHGGTYLAYLRRYSDHSCTPLLATCHAQPPLFRLQENLTKRFPSYSILEAFCAVFDPLQLASAAALEPDYGLAELNLLLDHYGGVVAKGDLSRRIRLEWKTNEANPSAPAEMSCDGSAEDEEEEEENEEEIEYVRPFINVDRVLQEYPIFLRAVQEQVQHTSPPRISNTHPTSHQQRNHHLYRWASGSRTTPRTFPGDEQLTL
jgi:hypothetical protein